MTRSFVFDFTKATQATNAVVFARQLLFQEIAKHHYNMLLTEGSASSLLILPLITCAYRVITLLSGGKLSCHEKARITEPRCGIRGDQPTPRENLTNTVLHRSLACFSLPGVKTRSGRYELGTTILSAPTFILPITSTLICLLRPTRLSP